VSTSWVWLPGAPINRSKSLAACAVACRNPRSCALSATPTETATATSKGAIQATQRNARRSASTTGQGFMARAPSLL
jgi:hypothetical protein